MTSYNGVLKHISLRKTKRITISYLIISPSYCKSLGLKLPLGIYSITLGTVLFCIAVLEMH